MLALELTYLCLYTQKHPANFGIILKASAFFENNLKDKRWTHTNWQLSFKYFVNRLLNPKIFSKLARVQTTLVFKF